MSYHIMHYIRLFIQFPLNQSNFKFAFKKKKENKLKALERDI